MANSSLLGNKSEESVMEWKKAIEGDGDELTRLIHQTVQTIYPKYYPAEVVDFFCMHHSKERVQADIKAGNVWILQNDGCIIGTGSMKEDHITRVYVLPEFQGKGYGTRIIKKLEQIIGGSYKRARLDASLSSCCLYEKLGYHTIRHERIHLINDVVLVYEVMEKELEF